MSSNQETEVHERKIIINGLIYLINEYEKTAIVKGRSTFGYCQKFLISRSITHESQEYIVTKISDKAYENADTIVNIRFAPDSDLKIIGEYSFSYTGIESITFPPHLTEIGSHAFFYCSKLKRVEIPDNSELIKIGSCAFYSTKIETISIPAKTSQIEKDFICYTPNLNTISVSENNPYFKSFKNKYLLRKSENKFNILFCSIKNIEIADIPD